VSQAEHEQMLWHILRKDIDRKTQTDNRQLRNVCEGFL